MHIDTTPVCPVSGGADDGMVVALALNGHNLLLHILSNLCDTPTRLPRIRTIGDGGSSPEAIF